MLFLHLCPLWQFIFIVRLAIRSQFVPHLRQLKFKFALILLFSLFCVRVFSQIFFFDVHIKQYISLPFHHQMQWKCVATFQSLNWQSQILQLSVNANNLISSEFKCSFIYLFLLPSLYGVYYHVGVFFSQLFYSFHFATWYSRVSYKLIRSRVSRFEMETTPTNFQQVAEFFYFSKILISHRVNIQVLMIEARGEQAQQV